MVTRRRAKQAVQRQPEAKRLQTAEGWCREIIATYGKPPHPVQSEKQIEQKSPRG